MIRSGYGAALKAKQHYRTICFQELWTHDPFFLGSEKVSQNVAIERITRIQIVYISI